MIFRFNSEKNAKLIEERKVSFEEIIEAIINGKILFNERHPNQKKYPNQEIFYVEIRDEVYSIPYIVESDEIIFLKTAFPNRKARKKLLNKKPRS